MASLQKNQKKSIAKIDKDDNKDISKAQKTVKENNSLPQKKAQEPAKISYLKNLLGKYAIQADFVQSFTSVKEQQCHEEIINGRYIIRKRDWSAEEQKSKTGRGEKIKNIGQMLFAKRKLEDQLQIIEGQIDESEQKMGKQLNEEQRVAFSKRMEKARKQIQRKKEEVAKIAEQRRLEEEKKLKQQKQQEQNEKKQKKQQEILSRLKSLEEIRKTKQQQFKNQAIVLKQKMKQKTLLDKIQEHYNLLQNESLQQRKKRLAEIRALHKPIDKKQLDAHAQKLQKIHAQKMAALALASAKDKNLQNPIVKFYKSVFYKRIKQEQKTFMDKKDEQQLQKLRENRDKLKKFAQSVRDNHKPTIDEKKVQQLKFRSVNLRNNRAMSSLKASQNNSTQKIGLRYLQYSKQQVDHQKLLVSGNESQQDSEKPKKMDYLAQLREKNKNRVSVSAQHLLSKLEHTDLSKQEKTKKILQFADKIEKTAKRKQQLQKIGNGMPDDELDALYLEAIQAKLGLLSDY